MTLIDACREQADLAKHHRPSAQSIPVPNRDVGFIAGAPPVYLLNLFLWSLTPLEIQGTLFNL
jgi:hypothetical protein